MGVGSDVARARSLLGVACRRKDADAVADARRELAFRKILAAVARARADAPALTPEQVEAVTRALRS